jgi:hypothetical protein
MEKEKMTKISKTQVTAYRRAIKRAQKNSMDLVHAWKIINQNIIFAGWEKEKNTFYPNPFKGCFLVEWNPCENKWESIWSDLPKINDLDAKMIGKLQEYFLD